MEKRMEKRTEEEGWGEGDGGLQVSKEEEVARDRGQGVAMPWRAG
jgi:hypothetical protein